MEISLSGFSFDGVAAQICRSCKGGTNPRLKDWRFSGLFCRFCRIGTGPAVRNPRANAIPKGLENWRAQKDSNPQPAD
jgi:hypothetical protein